MSLHNLILSSTTESVTSQPAAKVVPSTEANHPRLPPSFPSLNRKDMCSSTGIIVSVVLHKQLISGDQ